MYACITKNGSFECTQMFLASPQLSFEMDPIHLGHPVHHTKYIIHLQTRSYCASTRVMDVLRVIFVE